MKRISNNIKFDLHARLDYELALHGMKSNINIAVDKFTNKKFISELTNSDRLVAYYELDRLARVLLALANYVELTIDRGAVKDEQTS